MSKYKKQVEEMLEYHNDLFKAFKKLHDNYEKNPRKYQDEFNEEGQKILHIIRRYENILCGKSEGGMYGKFSSNLADKFREEIKIHFPKIDYIGMEIK